MSLIFKGSFHTRFGTRNNKKLCPASGLVDAKFLTIYLLQINYASV